MAAKRKWQHRVLAKYKGKLFVGLYVWVRGEREFHLNPINGGKRIAFESWQAARNAGWESK